jgi:SRSO17 transposase
VHLQGLMLDGRRKSIQPMANRLPDGNMQGLQQFVSPSPWGVDAGTAADRPKIV